MKLRSGIEGSRFLLGKLAPMIAGIALLQSASAVVVFNDDFTGTGVLDERGPVVGSYWTSTPSVDGSISLGSGAVSISGGSASDSVAWGGFSQTLSAENPLMVVTVNVASIGTIGLSGFSLHVGNSEKFFIGYRNNQTVYSVAGNGGGVGNNGNLGSGTGELTFTYNYNTGQVELFNPSGTKVFSKTGTAGFAFDTIRLVSGPQVAGQTKEFSVSDLNVQFIPEPSGALLGILSFGGLLLRRRRTV
jgi:hypothetical protein